MTPAGGAWSGLLGGRHTQAASTLSDLSSLTDADYRDLSATQAKELRALFEDKQVGLFLFCVLVCGFKDLKPSLHLPICQLIGRWGESVLDDGTIINTPPGLLEDRVVDSYRRLMIRIPRECFKTSTCTIAAPLWVLARDPSHSDTFGIFNTKAENAERWCGAQTQIVERSILFQRLWPEMLPRGISYLDREKGITKSRSLKWGEKGILFERSNHSSPQLSIEPHGIGGETTGKHFTRMVLDDIIGKEAAYSVAEMQSAINWVNHSRPLERPAENGCTLVPHTPWAFHDVYSHMLSRWPGEFKLYTRHLLEDASSQPDPVEGTSIFPEKISTPKAKQLLKVDPFINGAQYMCIPKPGRDQSFDDTWLRPGVLLWEGGEPVFRIDDAVYDPNLMDLTTGDDSAPQYVPLSWMDTAIILDPAPSKGNEIRQDPLANNGVVAVGTDPWHRRYVFECWRGREGPTEILHLIMAMASKYGIRRVAIEDVVFSAVYAPLFQQLVRHEYDWEPEFLLCSPKGRNKDARIKDNLIKWMENGYWYFNTVGTGYLRQELMEYPHGQTKDLPDALSYTDEVVYPRPSPDALHRGWYNKNVAPNASRGPTGYGAWMLSDTPNAPRLIQ